METGGRVHLPGAGATYTGEPGAFPHATAQLSPGPCSGKGVLDLCRLRVLPAQVPPSPASRLSRAPSTAMMQLQACLISPE